MEGVMGEDRRESYHVIHSCGASLDLSTAARPCARQVGYRMKSVSQAPRRRNASLIRRPNFF
jgi:hypothetical protein